MRLTNEQTALILSHVDLERIRETFQGRPIRTDTVAEVEAIANASLTNRWDDVERGWSLAGYPHHKLPERASLRVRMGWKALGEAELYLEIDEVVSISVSFRQPSEQPEDAPNARAWVPPGSPRGCTSERKTYLCELANCLRCTEAHEHNKAVTRRADFVAWLPAEEEEPS